MCIWFSTKAHIPILYSPQAELQGPVAYLDLLEKFKLLLPLKSQWKEVQADPHTMLVAYVVCLFQIKGTGRYSVKKELERLAYIKCCNYLLVSFWAMM